MQILSIHLKNIKSHRALDLEFAPGINVLSGPNGIGKSTIFEAIGYAMFGVDAQSFVGNIERFVTINERKGEVAVLFEIGGERFRVSRVAGTPAKWLLAREVGGEFEVEEHKDIKETETRLKELLGLDGGRSLAEQFELVIGPFQNEFLGPFVEKRPTTRRNKFDEILGIDSWRKTYSETSALMKAIQNKVALLREGIGPLEEQLAALPQKREAHKAAKTELAEAKVRYKEQQQELATLESRLAEIDKREQSVKDLGVEIDKLKERIGNGNEKIGSQKALIGEAEKARKIVAANSAGKESYERAATQLVALREQFKLQRQLEQELADCKNRVGRLEAKFMAEEKAIAEAGDALDAEENALNEKRKVLVVDEALAGLAARLPEVRTAVSRARSQLGNLEGRRAGLEEGQNKLVEGSCPFFQEPCQNLADRPPGDVFSARFVDLDQQRQRLQDEIKALEKDETEASAARERIKTIEVQLKGLDDQKKSLVDKRRANQERINGLTPLKQEQAKAQTQAAEKQKSLDSYGQLQADIEKAEEEQRRHQSARDLYLANREQAARLEGLEEELVRFDSLLKALHEELGDREQAHSVAAKEYDAEQHQALKLQKDHLRQEVGALGQKVEGLKADVDRLAGEIEKLKQIAKEIAGKKEQVKAYGEKEELVKFLRNRVFRNVSASLSERFREEISLRANRIYRVIAEVDEELAWGENYQIVLRDMVDGELRERADDQLSGGQTMSAVVALRLAMLQTIGARVAFFDEPTSNLDAARRENLARAFRSIDVGKEGVTEHWYDQLFLISHDVAFTEVTDQILHLEN